MTEENHVNHALLWPIFETAIFPTEFYNFTTTVADYVGFKVTISLNACGDDTDG
jgi:hypothetical protein